MRDHAPQPTAEQLAELAQRVLRLTVSRHNPEQFWLTKGEIAAELRRLARRIEAGAQ